MFGFHKFSQSRKSVSTIHLNSFKFALNAQEDIVSDPDKKSFLWQDDALVPIPSPDITTFRNKDTPLQFSSDKIKLYKQANISAAKHSLWVVYWLHQR